MEKQALRSSRENLFWRNRAIEKTKYIIFDLKKKEIEKLEDASVNDLLLELKIKEKRLILIEKIERSLKKISSKDMILFFEELRMLLESGVNFFDSLEIMYQTTENNDLKTKISLLKKTIKSGDGIAEGFRKSFIEADVVTISFLRIHENTGKITTALLNIVEYLKEKNETRKRICKTLYYPLFSLALTVLICFYFLNFFAPKMFLALEGALNSGSDIYFYFNISRYLFNILSFIFIFLSAAIYKNGILRKRILLFIYKNTIIKKFLDNFYLESFSFLLYHLLRSGVSILESLKIISRENLFESYQEQIKRAILLINQGNFLSESLPEIGFLGFSELMIIKNAEKSGKLTDSLLVIYRKTLERKEYFLRDIFIYAEPLLILLIGLIIGLISIAFYRLIFSYTSYIS